MPRKSEEKCSKQHLSVTCGSEADMQDLCCYEVTSRPPRSSNSRLGACGASFEVPAKYGPLCTERVQAQFDAKFRQDVFQPVLEKLRIDMAVPQIPNTVEEWKMHSLRAFGDAARRSQGTHQRIHEIAKQCFHGIKAWSIL